MANPILLSKAEICLRDKTGPSICMLGTSRTVDHSHLKTTVTISFYFSCFLKKRDENHWEKGDHSGARFDLCTVYGHIYQYFQLFQILYYFACLWLACIYLINLKYGLLLNRIQAHLPRILHPELG